MLATYQSPSGRQFVFNPGYPADGSFFYSPDGLAYYHLHNSGCAIGPTLHNSVHYQNVCHGISGHFFFDSETLKVEHESEEFSLNPDADFDESSINAHPVPRLAWRVLAHPDATLVYVSHVKRGSYDTDHRIYVVNEGITTAGVNARKNIVPNKETQFLTDESILVWFLNRQINRVQYSWNGTLLTEVPIGDCHILETLEGEVTITRK
jgi:hypothetical protein